MRTAPASPVMNSRRFMLVPSARREEQLARKVVWCLDLQHRVAGMGRAVAGLVREGHIGCRKAAQAGQHLTISKADK